MGRILTPKYRIETTERTPEGNFITVPSIWRGKVTDARVNDYMLTLNKSFLPNGVNFHVSQALNFVPYYFKAKVIEQKTGKVVAEWKAQTFQVM